MPTAGQGYPIALIANVPTQIPVSAKGTTLINQGAYSVNLSVSQNMTDPIALASNTSMPWPAGGTLWAQCSNNTTIIVLSEAYNYFNPTVYPTLNSTNLLNSFSWDANQSFDIDIPSWARSLILQQNPVGSTGYPNKAAEFAIGTLCSSYSVVDALAQKVTNYLPEGGTVPLPGIIDDYLTGYNVVPLPIGLYSTLTLGIMPINTGDTGLVNIYACPDIYPEPKLQRYVELLRNDNRNGTAVTTTTISLTSGQSSFIKLKSINITGIGTSTVSEGEISLGIYPSAGGFINNLGHYLIANPITSFNIDVSDVVNITDGTWVIGLSCPAGILVDANITMEVMV